MNKFTKHVLDIVKEFPVTIQENDELNYDIKVMQCETLFRLELFDDQIKLSFNNDKTTLNKNSDNFDIIFRKLLSKILAAAVNYCYKPAAVRNV